MPKITVSRDDLDRPIWREVGAYAKHKNPDGTYTVSYKDEIDPAKLKHRKPRKGTEAETAADDDHGPDSAT